MASGWQATTPPHGAGDDFLLGSSSRGSGDGAQRRSQSAADFFASRDAERALRASPGGSGDEPGLVPRVALDMCADPAGSCGHGQRAGSAGDARVSSCPHVVARLRV